MRQREREEIDVAVGHLLCIEEDRHRERQPHDKVHDDDDEYGPGETKVARAGSSECTSTAVNTVLCRVSGAELTPRTALGCMRWQPHR